MIGLINILTLPDAGCLGLARGARERHRQRQERDRDPCHEEPHGLRALLSGQQLRNEGMAWGFKNV